MRYSKSEFTFEVLKIIAIFFSGYALATLAGAQEEKAVLVGLVAFCGYVLGTHSRGP